MTREQLIELMARAVWEHSDETDPWDGLPQSVRDAWFTCQKSALEALARAIPAVHELVNSSMG
jgi:hypothetical protein